MRWAWRDLRGQAVAVVAIALVIAIGTGVYAGLGSTATWRELSNDASFEATAVHDLQVSLSPGTYTGAGTLAAAAASIPSADEIVATTERLVVSSQIDASTTSDSILVEARLVGMDLAGAPVDRLWVRDGSLPTSPTAAQDAAGVLELKFAEHWDLPVEGELTLAGGATVSWTGLGATPEDFFYEGPEGTIFSQGELAPLYLPLAEAQAVTGHLGEVNDLVMTLSEQADPAVVESELAAAMSELGVSALMTTRDETYAVRVLYEDIENDQRFWNALAGLVLAAAALAAFNLINRIVEAQRREIGIGMALGVSRWRLSIRPMLVGAQVALVGVVAGVGVGLLVGGAMQGLLESFVPLPEYRTPFQLGVYGRAAALGLAIPLLAAAIPVWRAVRVEPIKAIRTGHLAAKTSRFTDWTAKIPLPGSTFSQMPVRNLIRTPRRTLLTALGVGAAITALVGVLGLLDSFTRSIDDIGAELTKGDPDRVLVQLDTLQPADGDVVAGIGGLSTVRNADASLRLPVTAIGPDSGDEVVLLVELLDLSGAEWRPSFGATAGSGSEDGIALAPKAAADLGVSVGDEVLLRHPARLDDGRFAQVETRMPVTAIHVNPLRTFAYIDARHADVFGLVGIANTVTAYPSDGTTRAELQRSLFETNGVTSAQAVARISESFDEALDQFVGILAIAAIAVLVLALLIAFNATRITVEERRREHATMQAYGLPVRKVMGVVIKESVMLGLLATVIGVGAGLVFLGWMLRSLASTTLPDLQIDVFLATPTIVTAVIVGVLAVALAPVFVVRRLRKMNIPDTLRMME